MVKIKVVDEDIRAENEALIDLKLSESLSVEFEQDSIGGYLWLVEDKEEVTDLFDVNVTYQPRSRERIGSGTNTLYEFKPKKTGKVDIIFIKARPWDDDKVLDKYILRVKVVKK